MIVVELWSRFKGCILTTHSSYIVFYSWLFYCTDRQQFVLDPQTSWSHRLNSFFLPFGSKILYLSQNITHSLLNLPSSKIRESICRNLIKGKTFSLMVDETSVTDYVPGESSNSAVTWWFSFECEMDRYCSNIWRVLVGCLQKTVGLQATTPRFSLPIRTDCIRT